MMTIQYTMRTQTKCETKIHRKKGQENFIYADSLYFRYINTKATEPSAVHRFIFALYFYLGVWVSD